MIKEIGSEFEEKSFEVGKNCYLNLVDYPKIYVLSGRTGLYVIAKELKNKNSLEIALPSYCCYSMIEPFLSLNFKIEFYNDYLIPNSENILIMDYFGFLSYQNVLFAKKCKENKKKIIVDATQTAFSHAKTYEYADYIVASYRKWCDCLCGVVFSKNGFTCSEMINMNQNYNTMWRKASYLKRKFINGGLIEKKEFLNLFNQANTQLKLNYKNFTSNRDEINILKNINSDDLIYKRRKNAQVLIDGLKKYKVLMFEKLNDNDCPLFVPLLLEEDFKNKFKEELIKNKIYCPCHWPIENEKIQFKTAFHVHELSLICDQRYNTNDMNRIVKIFEKLYNEER